MAERLGSAVEQKPLDVRGAGDTAPPMVHYESADDYWRALCGAPLLRTVSGASVECVVCAGLARA